MAAVRGWQRTRWSVVGGGLLAALLLGPARAAADCGDYVTILPSPAEGSLVAHLAPQDQTSTALTDTGQVPLRKPCSGPTCSHVPFTPAPATAPPASAGVER